MTTLYSAICGNRFETDDDHVRVEAEHVQMSNRKPIDEFVFHIECWDRLSDGWMEPV